MKGLLSKLDGLLQGKKTIIVALLIGAGAFLQAKGISVPEWVYPILGAAGLGAVRSAIKKMEK